MILDRRRPPAFLAIVRVRVLVRARVHAVVVRDVHVHRPVTKMLIRVIVPPIVHAFPHGCHAFVKVDPRFYPHIRRVCQLALNLRHERGDLTAVRRRGAHLLGAHRE